MTAAPTFNTEKYYFFTERSEKMGGRSLAVTLDDQVWQSVLNSLSDWHLLRGPSVEGHGHRKYLDDAFTIIVQTQK